MNLIIPRDISQNEPNKADSAELKAAFSTRSGGVSEYPFDSLNLGLSTNDSAERVRENRRRVATALGFQVSNLAIAGQVHGHRVRRVREGGLYSGFDGLVTDQKNVLLCISAADCAAVLIWDREAGVVGACHAGWRGAVGGVVGNTIEIMKSCGATTDPLHAWVSPCLGVENFEVGEEVASRFPTECVVRRSEWPKPHLDLGGFVRRQMIQQGISEQQIEISGRCSMQEEDVFFSHRGQNGLTGRMMGMIGTRI